MRRNCLAKVRISENNTKQKIFFLFLLSSVSTFDHRSKVQNNFPYYQVFPHFFQLFLQLFFRLTTVRNNQPLYLRQVPLCRRNQPLYVSHQPLLRLHQAHGNQVTVLIGQRGRTNIQVFIYSNMTGRFFTFPGKVDLEILLLYIIYIIVRVRPCAPSLLVSVSRS